MNLKEAREEMRTWSADLAALKDQVDVSIGKDDETSVAILAAWRLARMNFKMACQDYVEALS